MLSFELLTYLTADRTPFHVKPPIPERSEDRASKT